MNCKQCRAESMESARSGAVSMTAEAHRKTCAACAQFFESQSALSSGFAALAAATAPDAPPAIENHVLAAFDARWWAQPSVRWWMAVSAAAAMVVVALAVTAVAFHRPSSQSRAAETPFIEIPYTAPLAPYERTEIKRMNVPIAALIAAGYEVHASDAGSALRADVLFGQDGRAHAIRLITNNERKINR